MPQPYKGRRVRATVRLPYDVASIAARHAARNGWSMSQYIAWCVERMNDKRGRDAPTPVEAMARTGAPTSPENEQVFVL